MKLCLERCLLVLPFHAASSSSAGARESMERWSAPCDAFRVSRLERLATSGNCVPNGKSGLQGPRCERQAGPLLMAACVRQCCTGDCATSVGIFVLWFDKLPRE